MGIRTLLLVLFTCVTQHTAVLLGNSSTLNKRGETPPRCNRTTPADFSLANPAGNAQTIFSFPAVMAFHEALTKELVAVMAASSFVKMPFCKYRVGSWIKVLVPPGTPYQHHTESEMLFLISGRPESVSYDSFNQVVYSSSVIFPLSHSAFFSLARSPQAYSSSGRIFPDFVQANRFL